MPSILRAFATPALLVAVVSLPRLALAAANGVVECSTTYSFHGRPKPPKPVKDGEKAPEKKKDVYCTPFTTSGGPKIQPIKYGDSGSVSENGVDEDKNLQISVRVWRASEDAVRALIRMREVGSEVWRAFSQGRVNDDDGTGPLIMYAPYNDLESAKEPDCIFSHHVTVRCTLKSAAGEAKPVVPAAPKPTAEQLGRSIDPLELFVPKEPLAFSLTD